MFLLYQALPDWFRRSLCHHQIHKKPTLGARDCRDVATNKTRHCNHCIERSAVRIGAPLSLHLGGLFSVYLSVFVRVSPLNDLRVKRNFMSSTYHTMKKTCSRNCSSRLLPYTVVCCAIRVPIMYGENEIVTYSNHNQEKVLLHRYRIPFEASGT